MRWFKTINYPRYMTLLYEWIKEIGKSSCCYIEIFKNNIIIDIERKNLRNLLISKFFDCNIIKKYWLYF
jgi:hypothetical protein